MMGTPTSLDTPQLESSRSALEFIHRLLLLPAEEQANLNELFEELTTVFTASAAGLATFPEGVPLCIYPTPRDDDRSLIEDLKSWLNQQSETGHSHSACAAVTVPRRAGGSCLVTLLGTPECGGWLLWLEDDRRTAWSASEAGLLVMVGQTLMSRLMRDERATPWAEQLERGIRRQRMEAAANLVRRLAHDFGNVLTGILGFSELALSDKDASRSPLHEYLSEVHRGAQSGAHFTSQLRLFSRRQANCNRSCHLAQVLTELTAKYRSAGVQVKLHVPEELPAPALDSESLRQVMTIVLDNAREAIATSGVIDVSARTVQVTDAEAGRLFGDVRSGKHVEIRITDNGAGLTPEAQRQLFAEPFFSTKSRKRGFGLAMAYGILSAHRGGLELLPRLEGGTIARLIVPGASVAGPSF